MTRWQVQAGGDAPPGTHRDLAEKLGKLLSQAKFGTAATHFGSADVTDGEQVNGPIHLPVPKADDGEQGTEGEAM